jgi:hypothetical protein
MPTLACASEAVLAQLLMSSFWSELELIFLGVQNVLLGARALAATCTVCLCNPASH